MFPGITKMADVRDSGSRTGKVCNSYLDVCIYAGDKIHYRNNLNRILITEVNCLFGICLRILTYGSINCVMDKYNAKKTMVYCSTLER